MPDNQTFVAVVGADNKQVAQTAAGCTSAVFVVDIPVVAGVAAPPVAAEWAMAAVLVPEG